MVVFFARWVRGLLTWIIENAEADEAKPERAI
jgi:hypothetical protein